MTGTKTIPFDDESSAGASLDFKGRAWREVVAAKTGEAIVFNPKPPEIAPGALSEAAGEGVVSAVDHWQDGSAVALADPESGCCRRDRPPEHRMSGKLGFTGRQRGNKVISGGAAFKRAGCCFGAHGCCVTRHRQQLRKKARKKEHNEAMARSALNAGDRKQ